MLTDARATPRPPHRLMRHANSIVRLLHLHFSIGSTLRILRVLHVARPEGEVVPEQLHNERRVFVRLLAQRVQLRNRLVERLLRQVARALGTVQNLVVEDAEVERKAEANRVRGREVHERNVLRSLVREQRCLGSFLAIRACLELRQVAVVITLHLQVEHLALAAARAADEVVVQQLEDAAAYILELLLDLCWLSSCMERFVSGDSLNDPWQRRVLTVIAPFGVVQHAAVCVRARVHTTKAESTLRTHAACPQHALESFPKAPPGLPRALP